MPEGCLGFSCSQRRCRAERSPLFVLLPIVLQGSEHLPLLKMLPLVLQGQALAFSYAATLQVLQGTKHRSLRKMLPQVLQDRSSPVPCCSASKSGARFSTCPRLCCYQRCCQAASCRPISAQEPSKIPSERSQHVCDTVI
jgi:hypothetical protein